MQIEMANNALQIIQKELDLIDNTISRLDIQVQQSKVLCITLWTAWNGWFLSNKSALDINIGAILLGGIVFPLVFWAIDYHYRRALLGVSRRQSAISLFLNSEKGKKFLRSETIENTDLPLLDPVGWIYEYDLKKSIAECDAQVTTKHGSHLSTGLNFWSVLFHKEVGWFYLPLLLVSLVLGIIFMTCLS